MNKSSEYRLIAIFVAVVFLIFNVGLPVVIASCPMTESKMPACGMCNDEPNATAQKLTSMKNTSCCRTVVAAEKNTTEFVPVKSTLKEPPKDVVSTLVSFTTRIFDQSTSFESRENRPPPLLIDIPIFTSSLLI